MILESVTSCSDELINLVGDLLDELGEEWNKEDLRKSFHKYFSGGFFKCYGAYDNGLVGVIAFFITPQLHNYNNKVANEAFWYVKPSYRGLVGGKLLDLVEKDLECATISFGISEPRLVKLMERRGYKARKTIMEIRK